AWLADKGYDERMGARPLARVIQEHIKKPLAEEVLFGKLKLAGMVRVDVSTEADVKTSLTLETIADKPVKLKKDIPAEKKPPRKKSVAPTKAEKEKVLAGKNESQPKEQKASGRTSPTKSSVPKVPRKK